MTSVFIVEWWDGDRHTERLAVFSNRERAKFWLTEYAAVFPAKPGRYDIVECFLDPRPFRDPQ